MRSATPTTTWASSLFCSEVASGMSVGRVGGLASVMPETQAAGAAAFSKPAKKFRL